MTTRRIFAKPAPRRRPSLALLFTLLVLSALTVGCTTPPPPAAPDRSGGQIELLPVVWQATVPFVPGKGSAGQADFRDLDALLGGRTIPNSARLVMIASYLENAETKARLKAVADRTASRIGRRPEWMREPTGEAPAELNQVVLRIETLVARHTGCTGGMVDPARSPLNQDAGWFGCATMANLAAMVADPADLYAPGQASPARGDIADSALQRYRANERILPEVFSTTN